MYVGNNPINLTDPSGKYWGAFSIDNIHKDWNSCQYGKAIAKTAVVAVGTGVAAAAAAGAIYLGAEAIGIIGTTLVAYPQIQNITFGHGARHLIGSNLTQEVVEAAIKSDIINKGGAAGLGETVERLIVVQGTNIIYRANMWKEGIINVGTYFLKP